MLFAFDGLELMLVSSSTIVVRLLLLVLDVNLFLVLVCLPHQTFESSN